MSSRRSIDCGSAHDDCPWCNPSAHAQWQCHGDPSGHLLWHAVDPEALIEPPLYPNRASRCPPHLDEEVVHTAQSVIRRHERLPYC